jgi:hypothetical protein
LEPPEQPVANIAVEHISTVIVIRPTRDAMRA